MLDRYDSNEFETITYQAETGGLSCPDAVTRLHYYDVTGLPTLLFNGTTRLVGAGPEVEDGGPYDALVQGLLDDPSPLRLTVTDHAFGGATGFVDLEVVAEQAVAGAADKQIRIAIVEDGCEYLGTVYDNVVRGMLPDIPLTADALGEVQLVSESFPLEFFWNDEHLRLVAWVQDDASREVLQMASSRPRPPHSLRYYALGERTVITDAAHTFGEVVFFNTGALADTVTLELDVDQLPPGWAASFRIGGQDLTSFTTPLAAGERVGTVVSIAPGGAGQGTVPLVCRSHSGLIDDRALAYSVITSDTEVLIVDDDGGEDYESRYFAPAVAATGRSFAVWDRRASSLAAEVLAHFDVVVWQCGWAFPTVDAADRAALADYLDAGGSLFITGQDIGWELTTGGGDGLAWYHDYLHAVFVSDDTDDLDLDGVPGDPIGDGVDLVITGGDGADNQDYPSDIDPLDAGASVVFTYDTARNGAIKADTGAYRVVYLAFGFEAIDSAADRDLVMRRALDWLAPGPLDAAPAAPASLVLLGNAPNPCNPGTVVRYRLVVAAPVVLEIHDLRGRRLRRIETARQAAGEHGLAWDGRDEAGRPLASGSYLYRLSAGDAARSGKLTLVR